MPVNNRADAVREYLTGDTGSITTTQADGLLIYVETAIPGVIINYAAPSNPLGVSHLIPLDYRTLSWRAGPGVRFPPGTTTQVLEAKGNPTQFLRVTATPPFPPGHSKIILTEPQGFADTLSADAITGLNQYRSTVLQNVSAGPVTNISRSLTALGTSQVSDVAWLSASAVAGHLRTSGSFVTWPTSGWCRIDLSDGTLREIIYYSSRTATVLTVASRERFRTVATEGLSTDVLNAIPGVVIGLDINGVQDNGSTVPLLPTNVVWFSKTLSIPDLAVGKQIGLWIWQEIPAGAIFTTCQRAAFTTVFNSY